MSVTEKIKEATDKLKDKFKGAKAAAHSEAQHETSESERIAKDMKGEAQYQTSESERIAKDLRKKAEEKAGEVKKHFDKH